MKTQICLYLVQPCRDTHDYFKAARVVHDTGDLEELSRSVAVSALLDYSVASVHIDSTEE